MADLLHVVIVLVHWVLIKLILKKGFVVIFHDKLLSAAEPHRPTERPLASYLSYCTCGGVSIETHRRVGRCCCTHLWASVNNRKPPSEWTAIWFPQSPCFIGDTRWSAVDVNRRTFESQREKSLIHTPSGLGLRRRKEWVCSWTQRLPGGRLPSPLTSTCRGLAGSRHGKRWPSTGQKVLENTVVKPRGEVLTNLLVQISIYEVHSAYFSYRGQFTCNEYKKAFKRSSVDLEGAIWQNII